MARVGCSDVKDPGAQRAARSGAAVEVAGREIPSISRELIVKYVDDMRLLGML